MILFISGWICNKKQLTTTSLNRGKIENMESSELRLGNYLNVPRKDQSPFRIDMFEYLGKGYGKVGMSVMEGGHPLTWELKDLQPIPLTEDILLKCGFGKTLSEGVYSVMDEDIYLKRNKDGWEYQICISSNDGEFIILACIQFLHEVQNLFYSLNKQELQINL